MFPIEKYKFAERINDKGGKQVIAITTFAGKTVKGVANCSPADTFSIEFGKKLAAARCDAKVCYKRFCRADNKVIEAKKAVEEAQAYLDRMIAYKNDAFDACVAAEAEVEVILRGEN